MNDVRGGSTVQAGSAAGVCHRLPLTENERWGGRAAWEAPGKGWLCCKGQTPRLKWLTSIGFNTFSELASRLITEILNLSTSVLRPAVFPYHSVHPAMSCSSGCLVLTVFYTVYPAGWHFPEAEELRVIPCFNLLYSFKRISVKIFLNIANYYLSLYVLRKRHHIIQSRLEFCNRGSFGEVLDWYVIRLNE